MDKKQYTTKDILTKTTQKKLSPVNRKDLTEAIKLPGPANCNKNLQSLTSSIYRDNVPLSRKENEKIFPPNTEIMTVQLLQK